MKYLLLLILCQSCLLSGFIDEDSRVQYKNDSNLDITGLRFAGEELFWNGRLASGEKTKVITHKYRGLFQLEVQIDSTEWSSVANKIDYAGGSQIIFLQKNSGAWITK